MPLRLFNLPNGYRYCVITLILACVFKPIFALKISNCPGIYKTSYDLWIMHLWHYYLNLDPKIFYGYSYHL